MANPLSIGIVQSNPLVGDVVGNSERIAEAYDAAVTAGADLVVTAELSLLGYPPRDLLHRQELHTATTAALNKLATKTAHGPPLVVGTATPTDTSTGQPLHNSAVVLRDGQRAATYNKQLLPTYDVFDEHRYFQPGTSPVVTEIAGVAVGLTICEDAWHDTTVTGQRRHDTNPLAETAAAGADIIITLSASPFSLDKPRRREQRFVGHAAETNCPVVFVNQLGGNDELIFDGHSLVATADGVTTRLAGFEATDTVIDVGAEPETVDTYSRDRRSQARAALYLGIRDYFQKTGFDEAVIGLSGGIDSSVAAALATEALGDENVYAVSLPSAVTSKQSVADARTVATNLGIEFDTVPIGETVERMKSQLARHTDAPTGVTVENLQARVRGDVLMSIANERDALVLTPDNKSEAAVGYCTLYGDTVGAIAPLGDCYKKLVYSLARDINDSPPDSGSTAPIPQAVIDKPPSAELREDQTDTDELGSYETLDTVLTEYIEETTPKQSLSDRHGTTTVETIVSRVTRAEFKRRQTPPPLRITQKSLGRGWNYPIAARYDH
jgi:NAD+ synthase/NAD+ synthase (glutamine-hydrolysing)